MKVELNAAIAQLMTLYGVAMGQVEEADNEADNNKAAENYEAVALGIEDAIDALREALGHYAE